MAAEGTVLVPTLVTYLAMEELGEKHGLPARNRAKNRGVLEAGLRAVELASAAGVRMGLGSDLLGESHGLQAREFELRGDLQSAAAVLHAAFVVNAELCGLAGEIGMLVPGAHGDVIVVDEDPTVHVGSLARSETNLHAVVQAGEVVFCR